jgi:hypothetical protein
VNKKSKKYISDRFLMFHLVQNLMFYLVLFIVPSVSARGCEIGHSPANYIALFAFMAIVLMIDSVNLRQHIKKEMMKLELKNYYGKNKQRQKLLDLFKIYIEALFELFLT